jgi:type II secretory pathway component GspD/PulD (secretin)
MPIKFTRGLRKFFAAASMLAVSAAGLLGCQTPAPDKPGSGFSSFFDPTIDDLIYAQAVTATAPVEPAILQQADKATLVYTPRHARSEVLKDAISGMLNPDGTAQESIALNALIVQDQKDIVNNILSVLKLIDVASPQLLVEARVVEVTMDDDLEYEIKHTLTVSASPSAFFQNSDITLKVPGAAPTDGQGGELHIRPWASADIRLDNFIRLLQTRGKANVLSSPNVIVSPGTEASINTGQEVPIINQTISAGGTSNNTTFKRVGIKLRVALQQIAHNTARLEINPEVSNVIGYTQVTGSLPVPIISLRNVSSTVSLMDGEILTIGGLLQDEHQKTTRGIPFLQDIPALGLLTQSQRDQSTRTQLIFFLRVHILPEGVPHGTLIHKPGASLEGILNGTQPANPDDPNKPPSTQAAAPKEDVK